MRPVVRLAQLPVPPPAALAPTGNVPLAGGCLSVSLRVRGPADRVRAEVVPADESDPLGDTLLADRLAAGEPEILGLSAYLWNVERSLHVAREVKRRSPRTRVVLGGPEIQPDNPWPAAAEGWDFAVSGEAEAVFPALVARVLDEESPRGLPGVAVAGEPFAAPEAATFALSEYPSPYLDGTLEPSGTVGIETARGCRSHCSFCSYPRSRHVLRTMSPDAVGRLLASLRDRGVRDVVFLDPTFNHRPDFRELLREVESANPRRAMALAAEVRAEGLTAEDAQALARAGFVHLEIGLQSTRADTLRRVGRGGRPATVLETARRLRDLGIQVQVDLIAGLPGETGEDLVRGAETLAQAGLAAEAQVFLLSVLPGTALRADAAATGMDHDPLPPYHVRRANGIGIDAWIEAVRRAEDVLERSVDEQPRPHLCDPGPLPDVFRVDLDDATPESLSRAAAPGARHAALRFEGADLFARRATLLGALDARLAVDPFSTLDVVLRPSRPFPFDLLDAIRARLASATQSFASRALAWRQVDLQRRIAVVLPRNARFSEGWMLGLSEVVPVFREQSMADAAARAADLGDTMPAALVVEAGAGDAWLRLLRRADPASVAFADRGLEQAWLREAVGLGGWQRTVT